MASQDSDGEAVMQAMKDVAASGKVVYSKHMGKFLTCVQRKWLKEGVHVVRGFHGSLFERNRAQMRQRNARGNPITLIFSVGMRMDMKIA
jgi:hypothetical protein